MALFEKLKIACENNETDQIEKLFRECMSTKKPLDDEKDTPLHVACKYGTLEVVMNMIDNDAKVNVKTKTNQQNPIHSTCYSHTDALEKLKVLVPRMDAPSVNNKDSHGDTPLHLATRFQTVEEVKWLLAHGADPKIEDKDRLNAIHIACEDVTDAYKKVQSFIHHDRKLVHKFDAKHHTPLHHACDLGPPSVVKLLLDHGASANFKSDDRFEFGTYPLHCCFNDLGHPMFPALKELHSTQEDWSSHREQEVDDDSRRAKALESNKSQQSVLQKVQYLLDHDAHVNQANLYGNTPLVAAITNGYHAAAVLLLDHGADPTIKGKDGKLPKSHVREPKSATSDDEKAQQELYDRLVKAKNAVASKGK